MTLPGPRSRLVPLGLALLVPVAVYCAFATFIWAGAALETARGLAPVPRVLVVGVLVLIPALPDALVLIAGVELLYHLAGHETLTATPWMLIDTRKVLLFARRRRWPALRVSNLRVSPMSGGPHDADSISRRGILFEVDAKRTRAVAEGCTPQEAAEVFEALREAVNRPTITR